MAEIKEILQYLMSFAFPMGFIITFAFMLRKSTRHVIRVEWDKVAMFLAFLALLTVIRIAQFDLLNDLSQGTMSLPSMPNELAGKPMWKFLLVFWEDAFYGIPIYFAWKHLKKFPAILITIALSLWFGSGHAYQGQAAVFVTALYPYFISNRYGAKVGFGTVMICHIIYDFVTFYTMYFMPHLI